MFYTQNDNFSIFEGVLTCQHYNEVILVTWYQSKEEVHSFSLVANVELYTFMTFNIDNSEGGCSNLLENMIGKNAVEN